jgi:hypothetical protein
MKTIVWAAMQSMSTLEQVDRMLPDLIDETELKNSPGRYRYRRGLNKSSSKKSTTAMGIALVTVGILMLIPGPVDLAFAGAGAAIGGYIAGPAGAAMGAVIGLAIYNVMAVIVVIVGITLIVAGLLGA